MTPHRREASSRAHEGRIFETGGVRRVVVEARGAGGAFGSVVVVLWAMPVGERTWQ